MTVGRLGIHLLRLRVEGVAYGHVLVYQKCRVEQLALLAFDQLPSDALLEVNCVHAKRNHFSAFRARYQIF